MGEKNRFYADIMAMHSEVTGSCMLVIVKLPDHETRKFVVDCGLFQEREYEENNEKLLFNASERPFQRGRLNIIMIVRPICINDM